MDYKTKISIRSVGGTLYYRKNDKGGITRIYNMKRKLRFLKLIMFFCKDYKLVKISDGYFCLVK